MRVFGILNITEDSFSDGGRYLATDRAMHRAWELLADGVDVVDVGPASSHPDSTPVSPATQISRLRPILASGLDLGRLSVDCTKTEVQGFALDQGVAYINDIRGFCDPTFYPRLADSDARLIVMHSISRSEIAMRSDVRPSEIINRVVRFFDQRLERLAAARISADRMIIDPGMGFFLGTNPQTSLEVLTGLGDLKGRFSLPMMVSVSRKSFLQALAGQPADKVDAATLAAELYCLDSGVEYVRTHDPKPLLQAAAVWNAVKRTPGH